MNRLENVRGATTFENINSVLHKVYSFLQQDETLIV
jgi:hypothetical protein